MSDATKSLGSRPLNTGTSLPLPIRDTLNDLRGLLGRFVFSQAMIRLSIWILLGFWFFGVVDSNLKKVWLEDSYFAATGARARMEFL